MRELEQPVLGAAGGLVLRPWEAEDAEVVLEVLGRVALREIRLSDGVGECTYWVLPKARNQGVASAATAEVTRWALNELGLHRLFLLHSTANPASCRVAAKAGFALEGTLRGAMLHPDGWHDMHLHGRVGADA
jgi:RimJ/RimL family protein N-acetyltransferase